MRNKWGKLISSKNTKDQGRERTRIYDQMYYPTLFREKESGTIIWDNNSVSQLQPKFEFISVYPLMAKQVGLMMCEGAWGEIPKKSYINSPLWWEARDSLHPSYCYRGELGTPFQYWCGRKWESVGYLELVLPLGMSRWMIIDGSGKLVDGIWPVCLTPEEAVFKQWKKIYHFRTKPNKYQLSHMMDNKAGYSAIPFDFERYKKEYLNDHTD